MPDREPCEVAGLSVAAWLELFNACHVAGVAGPQRVAWPDGRSTLRQPAVTVYMFAVAAEELQKETQRDDPKQ